MDVLRFRTPATGLVWLAILAAACGNGSDTSEEGVSWSRNRELAVVEIVVDLLGAHDGRIAVELTVLEGRPTHFAFQSAWSDGYAIHDLRFTDGEGRPIPFREERDRYLLEPLEGAVVTAAYEMELGGEGRHGNQGVVAEDHAMFDGRLFLLPQGAVPVGAARIRFVAPDGWTVGSPFREDDSWFYVDAFVPELTAAVLGATCMGVGLFEHSTRSVGEMEVRVASYAGWEPEHKQVLADKTFRMLEYFHETLGFDLRAPYSVVWVPKQGRNRVFGGSFANGTCYEHPHDLKRNWELLAHRIAHAVNHYRPSGMRIRDDEDSWFNEGWASYMEATATRGTGLVDKDIRWTSLHNNYQRTQRKSPELDIPLSREKQAHDETKTYLHYVKGPLAVKMLEQLVIARSGRNLEQFMAAMWKEYGWYEKPFPFREELEAFTGESFEDFWTLMVTSRGNVIPVWEDYLTSARLRAMQREPAATVGENPLRGDYLYHVAWSGDFRTFSAMREFLVQEAVRRLELEARGVRLYPDRIRQHLLALDPVDRYALARLEAAYPSHLLAGAGATDPSGRTSSGTVPRLVPNTDSEDGRIFAELMGLEDRGETAAGRGDQPWIEARVGSLSSPDRRRARLGFEDGGPVEVAVSRLPDVEGAAVAVLSGGHARIAKKIVAEPGSPARAILEPDDRPSGNRVIVLRLDTGDGASVSRAFWQRAGMRWPQARPASPEER